MGLDVSWYREIKPAPDAALDGDGYPDDWDFVRVDESVHFAERRTDLAPGIYSFAKSGSFRAGSYSGYNQWRDTLAEMVGYPALVEAPNASNSRHAAAAWGGHVGPFFELIHFSDCDGVIGTTISAKLAKEFAEHQAKAEGIGGYFAEKYADWRNAFEQAAHGGFVAFH
jgi:hypothetical protein